jgi:hypothetical protein
MKKWNSDFARKAVEVYWDIQSRTLLEGPTTTS